MTDASDMTASWRCFHCDELFADREAAAEHFGNGEYEAETALCVEAATADIRKLCLTNREMWTEIMSLRDEVEQLENEVEHFRYVARKLTKRPSATATDVENEWESMEGRVIAAEARSTGVER